LKSQIPSSIKLIDSHTGGEPTRTIVSGLDLPVGTIATRDYLASKAEHLRTTLINEPRGFDAIVGACLCPPSDPTCVTGVVFFNNLSYLHSCLHGTIGVVETLHHLGRIQPGEHRIETPIGIIPATLAPDHTITVKNVPSYRHAKAITVDVPGHGPVTGDIAWGGNWFFLISDQGPAIRPENIPHLTQFTQAVRDALHAQNITGANHEEIDHIESFAPHQPGIKADSQNFVLCPGSAYDRSPCGTGTSAKLACLAASGQLAEKQIWRQASIIGTIFEGTYQSLPNSNKITPIITGRAHITAEITLVIDETDPFKHGIPTKADS
jgi:4-hydroxyproline epimerase